MKRKKTILIFILLAAISAGISYLGGIFLPGKIKALVIQGIESATQKKASLGSVSLDLSRGIVLKELAVFDGANAFFKLKEASCSILLLPLFNKKIVISSAILSSPELYVERKADSTFNLTGLLVKKPDTAGKNQFSFLISKIKISDMRINFMDNTTKPPFINKIEHLDMRASMSLPSKIAFALRLKIPFSVPLTLSSDGEYDLFSQELSSVINIVGLTPDDFKNYFNNLGFSMPEGKINARIKLKLTPDKTLNLFLDTQNRGIVFLKENSAAKLNLDLASNVRYNFKSKQLDYSGSAGIHDLYVSGIEFIGSINNLRGTVKFNDSRLFSEDISAEVFGIPINAKIKLAGFANPLLDLDIASKLDLNTFQGILASKFKLTLPVQTDGPAGLSLKIIHRFNSAETPKINGVLGVINGSVSFDKDKPPVEGIKGEIKFSTNEVSWADLNFKYLTADYETSGILKDFKSPKIDLKLSSAGLLLESSFSLKGKSLNLTGVSGKYLNSKFALSGNLDFEKADNLNTDISGKLNFDLNDLNKIFKKDLAERLKPVKPGGILSAELSLIGNINDIKSCFINAKISSDSISGYGLKTGKLSAVYTQEDGIGIIEPLHLSLYEGAVEARGKIDLSKENILYSGNLDVKEVKIEKLKMDTNARDKTIAGTIKGEAKFNGVANDFSKLTAEGKVMITEGKLWELNLFKGLGALIFAKDFTSIVFNEGECGFNVKDKYIFVDNLKLKSNLTDISGSATIGFDNSINASLGIEILGNVPLADRLTNVTSAVLGRVVNLGVIKITGTLTEPKYEFKHLVTDVLKGIKDTLFGN